jgi:hypothetical protein
MTWSCVTGGFRVAAGFWWIVFAKPSVAQETHG